MTETEFLSTEDLLGLVRSLGARPVRDVGLLDSVGARPRSSVFGEDAYPTLVLKASAVLQSLATNHALVDGNKRLAWAAAAVFLDLNGYDIAVSDDVGLALVVDIVRDRLDIELIADRLRLRKRPLSRLGGRLG